MATVFNGTNKDILNCLQTAVIKRQRELERNDTTEQKVKFAKYKDAYNKTDTVYEYTYSVEDYRKIGLTDRDTIIAINQNIRDMSLYLSQEQMETLLINKREEVLANYKETNPYVLTLMGEPSNEKDYVYIPYHIDGVRDGIPVHTMTDGEISVIVNRGTLDELKEQNPTLDYLKFLNRRVTAYTVRTASQFALLYIDTTNYTVGYQVAEIYERYRMSFMRTIYNEYYNTSYEFYEALMGAYLISAVMFTILTENALSILEFDFTSDDILDSLYETFSIPNMEDLPKSVRIAFAEKINRILMNKGSRQSIIDIADAFGVGEVYQYVLYKEYRDAEVGYNPELSDEENYRLYFIRVPLKESDIHKYIYSTSSASDGQTKIPFDDFVSIDRRWGQGTDNLSSLVLSKDFSYMTTKYIGVDNVISLVDNALSQSEFLSILFSNKEKLGDYKLNLNRPNIMASLWDAFLYCMILIINKNGYEDTIIKDSEGLCYIYGINSELALTDEVIEEFKRHLPSKYYYLLNYQKPNKNMNVSQFMDLCIHNRDTLQALRDTILNWDGDYVIAQHLVKLEDIISHMQINTYYGEMKEYDTYSKYLEYTNPELYTHLESVQANPESADYEMREELLSAIEDLQRYCNPTDDPDKASILDFLNKIQEDEASTVKTSMFKMIAFLKSYTVDMRMTGTTYVFEDYVKIMSETVAKYNIYEWSRLSIKDECSITIHSRDLHSYLTFADQFKENSKFKISNMNLPPWLVHENDSEYIRPDYSMSVKDECYQSWYKAYEKSIVTQFDTLDSIKYKVYENDINEMFSFDEIFRSASHDYEDTYNYITSSYFVYNNYLEYSVGKTIDVIKRTNSEREFYETTTIMDTFVNVETGRLQTDI